MTMTMAGAPRHIGAVRPETIATIAAQYAASAAAAVPALRPGKDAQ